MGDRTLQALGALVIACSLIGLALLVGTAPVVRPLAITTWHAQPVPAR